MKIGEPYKYLLLLLDIWLGWYKTRNNAHMSAQFNFKVSQITLGVGSAQSADAIHYETIIGDGCLESLQSMPSHADWGR